DHHLERGGGTQHVTGDLGAAADHQRMEAFERLHELRALETDLLHDFVAGLANAVERPRVGFVGDQDLHAPGPRGARGAAPLTLRPMPGWRPRARPCPGGRTRWCTPRAHRSW